MKRKQVYRGINLGDIFLLPIPTKEKRHYFIVIGILQNNKKCLLTSFSSVKHDDSYKGRYWDKSCIISEKDNICFLSGKPLLKCESYIRYQKTIEMNYSDLLRLKNTMFFLGHVGFSPLHRIIKGAQETPEIDASLKIMYNISGYSR